MGKAPRDFKEKYGPWSIVIGASMGIGAACAKRLSIQRNTFLARLERIQKLLGVNLDDPAERLYVLISLMILDI